VDTSGSGSGSTGKTDSLGGGKGIDGVGGSETVLEVAGTGVQLITSTLTPYVSLSAGITLGTVGNVLDTVGDLGLAGITTDEVAGLALDDGGG
jgi:hypothetical protein